MNILRAIKDPNLFRSCHRAVQNQPLVGGSKPATLRWLSSYQFWSLHQVLSPHGQPATGRAETSLAW